MERKEYAEGWKCFNSDMTCRGFKFEIGKTYEEKGEIKLCKNGFHFHENMSDILRYYPSDSIVCRVRAWDVISDEDKSVARKILIEGVCKNEELNTGRGNSGRLNSGYRNSGNHNLGNHNSGNHNSGNRNSGNRNSGNHNSGNHNLGNHNSGNHNSGYYNSGSYNSGNRNSGNHNSGDYNSGDCNSGDCNSGDCNSGNYNSGLFCTDEPPLRLFNKQTSITRSDPRVERVRWLGPSLSEWVDWDNMTEQEKKEQKDAYVNGGYLKTYEYKEAWGKWWSETTEENRKAFLDLPEFDANIFKEITGIEV